MRRRLSKLQYGVQEIQRLRSVYSLSRTIAGIDACIESRIPLKDAASPVLFLNASTRIHHLSQNAAFQLFASWAVRMAGIPTLQVVCNRGMLQCMLGTNLSNPQARPPCAQCVGVSKRIYAKDSRIDLPLDRSSLGFIPELRTLSLSQLTEWHYHDFALGELCKPSLEWALRRTDLPDDPPTRSLLRKYLVSAASITNTFEKLLRELEPQAVLVFNGITYPEAVARSVAMRAGIPVITHEVGLRPFSAFFSHGHATAYPLTIPSSARLSDEEDAQLDSYLEERIQGRFSMAGVRFWPEIHDLPPWLEDKIRSYRQMVPIFANVIFDTSQVHANLLFEDMFAWLDDSIRMIDSQPDTLFVIRAHPDEMRPGKASRQSVAQWFEARDLYSRQNVIFIPSSEYISSYELIRRAAFVMVYNSSIGLEASIMGSQVLCAGKARYTQFPTVMFPKTQSEYHVLLDQLLAGKAERDARMQQNARTFLYYQLFRSSLDFSRFLRPNPMLSGAVVFEDFNFEELLPENAREMAILQRGILDGADFLY